MAVFSPDGTHIVTASADGTARIWEPFQEKNLYELRGQTGSLWTAQVTVKIINSSLPRVKMGLLAFGKHGAGETSLTYVGTMEVFGLRHSVRTASLLSLPDRMARYALGGLPPQTS